MFYRSCSDHQCSDAVRRQVFGQKWCQSIEREHLEAIRFEGHPN
jgi:hypothetical protein